MQGVGDIFNLTIRLNDSRSNGSAACSSCLAATTAAGEITNLSNLTLDLESLHNDSKNKFYWALVLTILPVLAIFGNILVIVSVYREKSLQSVTNYFIVSLAFADLLVGGVVMPFALYFLVSGVTCHLSAAQTTPPNSLLPSPTHRLLPVSFACRVIVGVSIEVISTFGEQDRGGSRQ